VIQKVSRQDFVITASNADLFQNSFIRILNGRLHLHKATVIDSDLIMSIAYDFS